jgi:predicted hydrolase (HD superfamily)
MNDTIPTRDATYELLIKYTKNPQLVNHALCVEAVMRHFAEMYQADPDTWGVVGLIHDLDYDQFPESHCQKTKEILEAERWPEELIRAVLSHGWGIVTDVEPLSDMEKVLYTIDELCGLIVATALVRPSKSILDTTVKSVKKKWKQKSFAAGANRDIIASGAERLGKDLDWVIGESIEGLKKAADVIGLKGSVDA